MTWNWQHKKWPGFHWDTAALDALENQFLHESGVMIGVTKHFNEEDKTLLIVDMITREALKTSEIEGEYLNRDSVQSSIRNNFGLETDNRRIPPAEKGVADMMVDAYHNFDAPLTHDQLFNWHKMLTNGRYDLQNIGSYRTHDDPMRVVSGAVYKPKIHFEAPPSKNMPTEMEQFIKWFAASAPNSKGALSTLTRAGVAHLYFVSIHPFEDGNGRIARTLAEKALSEGLGQPTLIALSQTIEMHRKLYYDALEFNNKGLDITNWLVYFAKTILSAQTYSRKTVNFLIEKTKFYDRFKDQLNARQGKVIERIFREGIEGFQGGLSAENYLTITGTSRATATRDLQKLIDMNVFRKTGVLKGTRYYLNIA